MTLLAARIFNLQTAPGREGLPYWILYLLLCIILLLLTFIFLRDKDLRRRLSAFLSGGRRKILRMRLQARLKKAKQTKTALIRELGERAWKGQIHKEKHSEVFRELNSLEEKKKDLESEIASTDSRITALQKGQDEYRRQLEDRIRQQEDAKKPFEAKKDSPEAERIVSQHLKQIAALKEESRERIREFQREIKEWQKKKEKLRAKAADIEEDRAPLLEELGTGLNQERAEHPELLAVFSQIDRASSDINHLNRQIERLS
jgi:chromosome segregation ATPase